MKNQQYLIKIFFTFILLLSPAAAIIVQSQTVIVPETLRGYWQFKTNDVSNWNGPVIGETFVEDFYKIGYTEQIEKQTDGSYNFILRNNNGDKTEFRMTLFTADSASIWYKDWKAPIHCKKYVLPLYTEKVEPTALPLCIYRKWVQGLNGKIIYEFTNDGKVQYDGKSWDILTAGNFLNKEYRLLVRYGNLYKLLYLSLPTSNILKVASEQKNEILNPSAENQDIYAISGCWINARTGDWACGFFENFAVYQNKFWEYEAIKTGKKKHTISLRNGKERLTVQMNRTKEDQCLMSFGKDKSQEYVLCNSRLLPHYSQPDNTPFANNGYTTDSVTITGYFRNLPSSQPFEIAIPDMVIDYGDNKYSANIDSLGRFSVRFPILNSNDAFIDWNRVSIWTSLEPGETYFLFVDFVTGQELFMGKNARFQNERLAYRDLNEHIPYEEGQNLSNLEFLHRIQKIYKHNQEHLEKYIETHPNLSEKFRYYSRQAIRYDSGSDLMQRRFNVNRNIKEQLEPEFMNYIDSVFVQNPVQPYTLLRDYHSFIRDYIGYLVDIDPNNKQFSFTLDNIKIAIEKLGNEGKLQLTDEDKEALDILPTVNDRLTQMKESGADSLTIIKFTQQLQQKMDKIGKLIESQAWITYVSEVNNPLKFTLKSLDSIPMNKQLREILITNLFYSISKDKHTPLSENQLAQLAERVSNTALLNYVQNQQTTYRMLSQKTMTHPESLKSNTPLEGITDGEEIFRKIIEPYKEKVIYLDVWGTWCGPCKAMMQYAGNIKKLFAGKDIIFLYLANRSSEESWKNLIKEYNLTGETSVHYNLPDGQQRAVEEFLGIRHFPTYLLIDKQGNINKEEAPRPNDETQLLNAVYRMLEQ